CNNEGDYW
nr:immunoglobulin heavy chain junction region [Macaca mulatta]MPN73155.1 immunoglobulin heavy chain junction region [Macaca mulatta]MPN73712.1 immunoglobulin heavy chain junction region [Macaca mulatta]MPN73846.1 immunoglobulin heavy chain junction region [Macaca mulatta]MPN74285.1 immunoglobulin heavy chain junction region [Macaca mulatta]